MAAFRRSYSQRIQVAFRKFLKTLANILYPKWLRKTSKSVQKSVRKAETQIAKSSRQVSKAVAKSSIGQSAKTVQKAAKKSERGIAVAFISFGKTVASIAAMLVPKPVRVFLRAMGQVFWRIFGVFFIFVGRWFRTRNYWHLLGGVPAFLLALPLAYCMVKIPFYGDAQKIGHYRRVYALAQKDKDYDVAKLSYRKLTQLGANDERIEYQRAFTAYRDGTEEEQTEAVAEMKRLAPSDKAGFPFAHAWLGNWYLSGESDLSKKEAERLAEIHLAFALERDPSNTLARSLRAMHFQRQGRLEEALQDLKSVVKDIPEQRIGLATLYLQQGKWEAAKDTVKKISSAYETKVSNGAKLEPFEYLLWAKANALQDKTSKADIDDLLDQAYQNRDPDDKAFATELHQIYKALATRPGEPMTNGDNAELLYRACELRPDQPDTFVNLALMTAEPGLAGEKAWEAVKRITSWEKPPVQIWSSVGTVAAQQGNWEVAAEYLNKAVELSPDDARSLNNAAYVLSQLGKDLEKALGLVTKALSLQPNNALYRETRGQIYLQQQKWQSAIDDFQFSLNGMSASKETHLGLALAYEKTNQPNLAQVHREKAMQFDK